MKRARRIGIAIIALLACIGGAAMAADAPKLIFQTDKPWSPRVNVQGDMVLAYGLDPSLPARIAGWRAHGYRVGFMTGVSWGHYADYLDGGFDGRTHHDEAQRIAGGEPLLHTGPEAPYFAPSQPYIDYLRHGVLRALEAGAESVFLEEPEYFANAGWSPLFKAAWQQHYSAPWQAPDSSPRAQWQASQLKATLYLDVLGRVCDAVRDWARQHARQVSCNIATHSLLNYTQWNIVSPGSRLASLRPDGLIGQVWTGTARAPNMLRGVPAERPFAQAFLEYAALTAWAKAAHAPIWLLADPVEDNPNHDWRDYRDNWQATLVASLLQPGSARFETLPWPHRIFDTDAHYPDGNGGRSDIPPDYQIVLQTVFDALSRMPEGGQWDQAGSEGVGVLVADSMMFQRAAPTPSDALIGDFHGLALPLLDAGIPATPLPMEAALADPAVLRGYRMLLLSYRAQLPPSPAFSDVLADWVRDGGILLLVDDDGNPYLGADVPEPTQASPRRQLFDALALDDDTPGLRSVQRGVFGWMRQAPSTLAAQADGADRLLQLARQAAQRGGLPWSQSPALVMRRGPYVIAGSMDGATEGHPLPGRYLDLLDATLPTLHTPVLAAGTRRLLLDLDAFTNDAPHLLAASGRVAALAVDASQVRFTLSGIRGRDARDHAMVALATPHAPTRIRVDDRELDDDDAHWHDGVLRLRLPASDIPMRVEVVLAGGRG